MKFTFEERPSDSPLVENIWRTESERTGNFASLAVCHWEMVVSKYQDKTVFTVRGPETKATEAQVNLVGAEFLGIVFKLGTFMPHLPTSQLVDTLTDLPQAVGQAFWLHGLAWEYPDFENADTFINRLVHEGLLVHDPLVDDALHEDRPLDLSVRALQYRFQRATGLTRKTVQQIQRARQAAALLEQGTPILDTAFELGYFDQPHLTRSLKRFIGQTPAQLTGVTQPE